MQSKNPPSPPTPAGKRKNVVLTARPVDLVFVTYLDQNGETKSTLVALGRNAGCVFEGRDLGLSRSSTGQGLAHDWLIAGIKQKIAEGGGEEPA
jgi:hypothetical protein